MQKKESGNQPVTPTSNNNTNNTKSSRSFAFYFFRILFITIFIGIFLYSAIKLLLIAYDYKETDSFYENTIQNYVVENAKSTPESGHGTTPSSVSEETPLEWYELVDVDLTYLQNINPDIKGWIYFENETISYPVLYSSDNNKYLRSTYTHKPATAGSIFIDEKNSYDFSDAHTIIYGHNMKNLSMFGKLKYYHNSPDYINTHKYFQIITNDTKYRYEVFAYQIVPGNDEIYSTLYEDFDDNYQNFINNKLLSKSLYSSEKKPTEKDSIITLSTCSTNNKNNRFILSAVLVDEHLYNE